MVGGNLVQVLQGMAEYRDVDRLKQYTCCKIIENGMYEAEGLQGLDVGIGADVLPYLIR